jgi:hypothetical protein
MHDMENYH